VGSSVQLDFARSKMRSEGQAASFMVHSTRRCPLGSFAESCPPEMVVLVVPSGGLIGEVVDEGLVDEASELMLNENKR